MTEAHHLPQVQCGKVHFPRHNLTGCKISKYCFRSAYLIRVGWLWSVSGSHLHALGLIGSPTVPKTLSDFRECRFTGCQNKCIELRSGKQPVNIFNLSTVVSSVKISSCLLWMITTLTKKLLNTIKIRCP